MYRQSRQKQNYLQRTMQQMQTALQQHSRAARLLPLHAALPAALNSQLLQSWKTQQQVWTMQQ
jgi:hypothetical protein